MAERTRTSLVPPRLFSIPRGRSQLEYSSRSLVFIPAVGPGGDRSGVGELRYPGWGCYATLYLWRKLVADRLGVRDV